MCIYIYIYTYIHIYTYSYDMYVYIYIYIQMQVDELLDEYHRMAETLRELAGPEGKQNIITHMII